MRNLFLYLGVSAALSFGAGPLGAAPAWQTLDNCKLLRHDGNDGDSFHVEQNGREYIFRLYFVDAPETDSDYPDRVAEQAKYFQVSPRRALEIGRQATRFTGRALSERFTVRTRWDNARGRSKLPRYYAVVLTSDKRDLGELLVQNGLARVFGEKAVGPDGRTTKSVEQKLRTLERQAKNTRAGGWSTADLSKLPEAEQAHRLAAASGERHNPRCPLFSATGNQPCAATAGRPCRLCGG